MTRDFDLLWDYDKPAETEANFRSMLAASDDVDYRLELLTQIARCKGLQREFEKAHLTLDDVERAVEDKPDRVQVRYLLERGRVFNSSGEKGRAKPLFLEAWTLADKLEEEFFAVDALHMIAIASPTEEQLDWNLKAVSVAKNAEDPRAKNWLGSLYNNIGWSYHGQKRYDEALKTFEQALVFRVGQGKREDILVARWCIGRCLRSLGRLDEALKIQQDLLESRELHMEPDAYVQEEMGELRLAQGKQADAARHFAKAYAQLSADSWFKANETERFERIRKLSVG
jgi:tetratricopeptide (TPR) repeat protein